MARKSGTSVGGTDLGICLCGAELRNGTYGPLHLSVSPQPAGRYFPFAGSCSADDAAKAEGTAAIQKNIVAWWPVLRCSPVRRVVSAADWNSIDHSGKGGVHHLNVCAFGAASGIVFS